jgi:hypothetical protein
LAGVPGIEPGSDRVKVYCLTTWLYPNHMVEEGGFEPPNPKELIYSQLRLAASLLLHCGIALVDVEGIEPTTSAV